MGQRTASVGLSTNDSKLGDEFRWIIVDGPYACPSKEDLLQITSHHTDEAELEIVKDLRAYYLLS